MSRETDKKYELAKAITKQLWVRGLITHDERIRINEATERKLKAN